MRNKNKVLYNPKGNTCTCIIYLASKFVTVPPENEAIPFFFIFSSNVNDVIEIEEFFFV